MRTMRTKRTKGIEHNEIQLDQCGHNWTKVDNIGHNQIMWRLLGKNRRYNWTNVDKQAKSGKNWTNVDTYRQKWTPSEKIGQNWPKVTQRHQLKTTIFPWLTPLMSLDVLHLNVLTLYCYIFRLLWILICTNPISIFLLKLLRTNKQLWDYPISSSKCNHFCHIIAQLVLKLQFQV